MYFIFDDDNDNDNDENDDNNGYDRGDSNDDDNDDATNDVHADDNADAIINIMLSEDTINEVFNIGSRYRITNNQLINLVSEVVGRKVKFEYVEDRLGHDRRYALNITKYNSKFGKIDYINLKEWLSKIITKNEVG